jgi:protein TonB
MNGAWRLVAAPCVAAALAWCGAFPTDGLAARSADVPAEATSAGVGGPGDSGAVAAVDEMPRPIRTVAPKYPEAARKRGQEGTVLVRTWVETDGGPRKVGVIPGKGVAPDLDQAAVAAVRQWRFEPARKDKEPVAVWVVIPVKFALR